MTNKEIQEVKRIALEYRESVLNGDSSKNMCWVITQPLSLLLTEEYGIKNEIVSCDVYIDELITEHFFIKIGTKILDATADQFGLEKVYYGSRPMKYQ